MPNQGESLANTWLIPQYPQDTTQAPQGPGGNAAPFNDGVPQFDALQHVEGQTADFYRKVADLKSFMQEAHNNFGIDVRVPDHSKGELGIKANAVYRKAIADIMAQGNLLKNSHSMLSTLANQRAHFYGDTTAMPAEKMQFGKDFTYEQIDPLVEEVNKSMEKAHYGGDYAEAKKLREQALSHYDQLIEEHPNLKTEYQRQKDAIMNPRQGVFRPNNQSYQERAYGRKVNAAGNFVDDITFLSNGARDSFTPDSTKLDEHGNPVMVSKEYTGWKFGDSIIRRWEMNPTTGGVEIVLANGSHIPASEDTGTIIRTLLMSNKERTGLDQMHLEEFLDKNNLQTSSSEVDQPAVMERRNKKWKDLQKSNIESSYKKRQEFVKPAIEDLETKLSAMEEPGIFANGSTIDLGGYQVHRGREGFEIENLRAKMPNFKTKMEATNYYAANHKFKTIDALKDFLIKNNVHMVDFLKKKRAEQPEEETGSQVAPTQQGLQPGSLD